MNNQAENPKYNKQSLYYTVDLEDFSFDLCRSIGTSSAPALRTESLRKSYHNITKLLSDNNHSASKITFFCTGVMADKYPDLIRAIAQDGHEIACHGNFHDDISGMTSEAVYASLHLAKQKLCEISGTEIRGFRAPRFSISKNDFERLDAISRVFDYDSSLHFSSDVEFKEWTDQVPIKMREFPVPQQSILSSKFKVKTGGSYIKLFPVSVVKNAIYQSLRNNMIPIVYLHPYDLFYGYNLLLKWSELRGAHSRKYWYVRQIQWTGMFNWAQERKLQNIFSEFNSLGRLDSCL
ncbi:polysaccharide deacetylase family protein [bacterium]|nr:polysaccharide deacetylase family protein [bacterium]